MGTNETTSFFRPIIEAVKLTKNASKAADNRNKTKVSLTTNGANDKNDCFSRVSENYQLTRDIYGERARADRILKKLRAAASADSPSAIEYKKGL
jgi:formiminotetrahydrofolate cyclodeaminase